MDINNIKVKYESLNTELRKALSRMEKTDSVFIIREAIKDIVNKYDEKDIFVPMIMGVLIFLQQIIALIAAKSSRGDNMTTIYTLPSCPICEMVKKKLTLKGIPFVERPFEELPEILDTDRAPVLAVDDSKVPGYPLFILSPTEINNWIEAI